jgi:hypothetical protein
MIRRAMAAALVGLLAASAVPAQAPVFRWQTGQVLVYRVEHATLLTDVVGEKKDETRTRMQVTRRWQVLGVEPSGVATLQMSVVALAYEISRPGGNVLRFDSADLDRSSPELVKQLRPYLGEPIVVLRIDAQGKVLEVKEARDSGSADKYEFEPPFVALLPTDGLKVGQAWERRFDLTVPPPAGVGDKYPIVERYTCAGLADGVATITIKTEAGELPEGTDPVPLWQAQREGEVLFDTTAGRLKSAVLKIDKEQKGMQAEDSSTRFQSTYILQYSGDR